MGNFQSAPKYSKQYLVSCDAVIHPSTIIRRSLQLKHPFHLEYKYSADYLFFVEILKEGGTYKYFDKVISCVNLQEGATATHWEKSLKDNLAILKKMGAPKDAVKKLEHRLFRNHIKKILLRGFPQYNKYFIRNAIKWGGWKPTHESYENRLLT